MTYPIEYIKWVSINGKIYDTEEEALNADIEHNKYKDKIRKLHSRLRIDKFTAIEICRLWTDIKKIMEE